MNINNNNINFFSKFIKKVTSKKIQQVLLNLFINAIHAIGKGGEIEVVLSKTAKEIQITVKDNGKGIAKKDLAKIFEPFHTSKEEGTGMGLAVSKEIVELHGGTIKATSTEGTGTTFTLSFPL